MCTVRSPMRVKPPPCEHVATLAIWFVGTASGPPPFRADYSQLWTRPEMRPMVFGWPDLANVAARPEKHSAAGAPHRFQSARRAMGDPSGHVTQPPAHRGKDPRRLKLEE